MTQPTQAEEFTPMIALAPDDTAERLAAIQQLANALMDSLPGDNWHLAHAIEQIASGAQTPADALAEVAE